MDGPIVISARKVGKKVEAVGKAKGNLLNVLPFAGYPFPDIALRGFEPRLSG